MEPVFVNLAEKVDPLAPKPRRRRPWRVFFFILALIMVGVLIAGGASLVAAYGLASSVDSKMIQGDDKGSVLSQLSTLVTAPDKQLRGEETGRINILLLGIGGANHDGPLLTDTMIVASIDAETKKVAMLSIPRDLVADLGGGDYLKINNAYAFGGIDLAKTAVQKVTGLDLNYYAVIDFSGFKDIVDDLGGIEVNVENAFSDSQYPDYNFGYHPISFKTGVQTMDGETALEFTRSRHGNNGEGSDFARSKRQQKVIMAIRDKFLSSHTLLNPTVITNVLDSVGTHLSTDAELWEMTRFAEIAKDIDTSNLQMQVLDYESAEGVIHSTISSMGAYILVPDAGLGNYSEIHEIANNMLTQSTTPEAPAEEMTVEVQNGTTVEGLARETADMLKKKGITVSEFKNATQRGMEVTVIYDMTNGTKSAALQQLQSILGANTSTDAPEWVTTATELPSTNGTTTPNVDFIVVVGSDRAS